MKVGEYLRHKVKPEWGICLVEKVIGYFFYVRFEDGSSRTFNDSSMFEAIPETVEIVQKFSRKAKERTATAVETCSHCKKRINRSYKSKDGKWKSCPNCSRSNGDEHVYYAYPDSFGTSEARVSTKSADGAQSYCIACRQDIKPDFRLKLCSQVA